MALLPWAKPDALRTEIVKACNLTVLKDGVAGNAALADEIRNSWVRRHVSAWREVSSSIRCRFNFPGKGHHAHFPRPEPSAGENALWRILANTLCSRYNLTAKLTRLAIGVARRRPGR